MNWDNVSWNLIKEFSTCFCHILCTVKHDHCSIVFTDRMGFIGKSVISDCVRNMLSIKVYSCVKKKNPGGGRNFPPVQTGPGAHPASCTMGTGSFPGVNCGRGVLLTTHPLLVPRSWKSRAIPLPTLWATPGL